MDTVSRKGPSSSYRPMAGLPFRRNSPCLLVSVDESGNPGKRESYKTHYIMAGCIVADRAGFEDVAIKNKPKNARELKFHDHPHLRIPVIEQAEPYVEAVYYVQFSKRANNWTGEEDKSVLHLNMLRSLAEAISHDYPFLDMDIVIDHTELVSDAEVKKVIKEIFSESGAVVNPVPAQSVKVPALQTNDFFVGAIGYFYNTPYKKGEKEGTGNSRYVSLFKSKLRQAYYRDYEPVVSKNRRKPATSLVAKKRATSSKPTSCGLPTGKTLAVLTRFPSPSGYIKQSESGNRGKSKLPHFAMKRRNMAEKTYSGVFRKFFRRNEK